MKSPAVFTNYLSLKSKLEKFAKSSNLTIDMSASPYIDHTVLEGLQHLQDDFFEHGGKVEIKGFENHNFTSHHPLASRSLISNPLLVSKDLDFTPRQLMLQQLANDREWDFEPRRSTGVLKFTLGHFDLIRRNKYCENMLIADHGWYK